MCSCPLKHGTRIEILELSGFLVFPNKYLYEKVDRWCIFLSNYEFLPTPTLFTEPNFWLRPRTTFVRFTTK